MELAADLGPRLGRATVLEAGEGLRRRSLLALSEDGRTVVSGSFDRTARLWDIETGQLLATLPGHTGGVWGVALSGDQRMAASGSVDGAVRLWDIPTAACLHVLQGDRRYERLDISGMTGVTESQREALLALGAHEQAWPTAGILSEWPRCQMAALISTSSRTSSASSSRRTCLRLRRS